MNQSLEKIAELGMLPVISIENAEAAVPLAKALSDGGLPFMEVMFRTEAAAESIRRIAQELPDFVIGAGTVLSIGQVKTAVEAGAQFIVAPGLNPEVAAYCVREGIPMVPGCDTPTEIEAAMKLGLTTLKFFPSIQLGGVATMKLLAGPYPKVRFVPTGDLDRAKAYEFLSFFKVSAAGGDFMLSYDDIHNRRFDAIRQSVEDTILGYLGFHIRHVGMNCENAGAAEALSSLLGRTLMLKQYPEEKCIFAGTLFEIMKTPFHGKNGHIAIGTADAERAYHYLKNKGISFEEDTLARDGNGRIRFVYLSGEFGGFALHLLQD